MEPIKELYIFMSDYLKLTIELYKKSLEIRRALKSVKIEELESVIRDIEEIELRVSVMEESMRTILQKISKKYNIPLSSITWDKLEEIGGKEVSRLGRTIEENLKKLIDENLINKLMLEKIMFINGELLDIVRREGEGKFYNSNGGIENPEIKPSIVEEG